MSNNSIKGCSCLLYIIYFIISGVCFDYCLWCIFGKDVPWYADFIAGIVLSAFMIPITVICWIIKLCDVSVPFIN